MNYKKIEKREIKLLKKERFFRLLRDIFTIIAIMILVGLISSFFIDSDVEGLYGKARNSGFSGFIICILLASNFQVYTKYIDSIKYHRGKNESEGQSGRP